MTEDDNDKDEFLLAAWRSAPSVDDQPSAVVQEWMFLQLPSDGSCGYDYRIVGRKPGGGWRVTTPLVSLDLSTMTGTTQSGRNYRLDGDMIDIENPSDVLIDVLRSWLSGTPYFISDVGVALPEDVAMDLAGPTPGRWM